MTHPKNGQHSEWNGICTIGGVAALSAVLVGLLEIVITFLPGGNITLGTVIDWFNLFHRNWFMGLRDMGLLNIFLDTLAIRSIWRFTRPTGKAPRRRRLPWP